MPGISVIVVSYNTRDLLRRCLRSLDAGCETIVVDNASSDGSAEMVATEFPDATLIRNAENRGFGAANNQGLAVARGKLVLLLNSDAAADPGAVATLAQAFDDPNVVAAGGRLHGSDGRTQLSTANRLTLWAVFCEQTALEKVFPGSRWFSPYWNTERLLAERKASALTEQVMGACLMMRPIERFDERFFLYCEDTELCRRLRRHGEIVFVPAAGFVHELGASSGGSARWRSVARYNRGKELYFSIHGGPIAAATAWALNRMGALLRLLIAGVACLLTLGVARRPRDRAALFAKVLFAPIDGP
ncbi:MAG TPA: glycosyltransferase family 2 protein [Fimbriimonadaceae bacterium]|nr:glycosyltransferase family 2 protein [Fimbriimonadaceae bacterium]